MHVYLYYYFDISSSLVAQLSYLIIVYTYVNLTIAV